MTRSLSFSFCSPFMSLCTHPDTPDSFIGSILFVPQMCLPVLCKYWPCPLVCSQVSLSSVLCWLHLCTHKLSSLSTRTSALITPWLLSLNTPANLQLITTQHRPISSDSPVMSQKSLYFSPKCLSNFQVHLPHLVMALPKYPEALSTRGIFRPLPL